MKKFILSLFIIVLFISCDDNKDTAPGENGNTSIPSSVTLYPITYNDGSFTVTWSQNNDDDYSSYKLYESMSEIMDDKILVYETEARGDTTCVIPDINENEFRYYQVFVENLLGLETYSNVLFGHTNFYKIYIDQAHNNYHTASGLYKPFADLLTYNGYEVKALQHGFSAYKAFEKIDVLVVSNALPDRYLYLEDWTAPTPSAFTELEIEKVQEWVASGGSLLLIADHMPFPGAAADLAAAFGVEFHNGYAFDTLSLSLPQMCLNSDDIHVFKRSDSSLTSHAVSNGLSESDRIDFVGTFTGQAFKGDEETEPLLLFKSSAVIIYPNYAWEFEELPKSSVDGWYQGAVKKYGQGRVAFFGEAAMFSEQRCDGNIPMGMNAPAASQNAQFILNLFLWLTNRLNNN